MGISLDDDAGAPKRDVDLGDPFRIDGVVPSHGPWTGGTRARLSGRGFSSKLRVWIGATELDASSIFASDPARAAIQTPEGTPGPVDVKIKDDVTQQERVLPAGFFYDAFVVVPDSGATTGGTRIALHGSGTAWQSGAIVSVDGVPCGSVAVVDATHLECTTAPGSPGTKDVTVTNPDASSLQARDAFTYNDSPDGFRGGITGSVLTGKLRVLAFDSWVGTPIPQAHVIAGGTLASAVLGTTNAAGLSELSDPKLTGKVTVTVAAKCHHPFTYVDVPVDTVTVYLSPVLDPACGSGDPPSTGGRGGMYGGEIDGELVWPGGIELARADWLNVPAPARENEHQVAYVFGASGSPLDGFILPPPEAAVTPKSPGAHGYSYATGAYPGNQTLYALAGIEDRSVTPPRFVPYVMGVARGVPVQPQVRTLGVDIEMSTLLDHRVRLLPEPPAPLPRGPDRLRTQLAASLGAAGFAIFPAGTDQSMLPLGGAGVTFTGVPALDGSLAGESYVVGANAATGAAFGLPTSVISRVRTTDSTNPVTIGGFLKVPDIQDPSRGTWSGTHVAFTASGAYDLSRIDVSSGGGLVGWTIIAPSGTTSFDLPDLRSLPGDPVGLVPGAIQTLVHVARLDHFSYAKLRSGQLGAGSWSAYAVDTVNGTY